MSRRSQDGQVIPFIGSGKLPVFEASVRMNPAVYDKVPGQRLAERGNILRADPRVLMNVVVIERNSYVSDAIRTLFRPKSETIPFVAVPVYAADEFVYAERPVLCVLSHIYRRW